MTLGWPCPILWQGQILQQAFIYKNVSVMDSMEIIAVCDLEIG